MSSCAVFRRAKATWRGIEFEWQREALNGSNRLAVHRYPFKKKHNITELGCDPDGFDVDGVICGDNLRDRIRELRAAFQETGPGQLYDPYLNEDRTVLVRRWEITPDKTNLTGVRFRATFIDAGTDPAPILTGDGTLAQLASTIENLEASIETAFTDTYSVAGDNGVAVEEAVIDTNALWTYLDESYRVAFSASFAFNLDLSLEASFSIDLSLPSFEVIVLAQQAASLEIIFDGVEANFSDDAALLFFSLVAAVELDRPDPELPGSEIVYRNTLAQEALVARLAFARYSAFVINREYTNQTEALEEIARMRTLADRIIFRADALGDIEVRQGVTCALALASGIASDLPVITTWQGEQRRSALALAHDIYCDTSRAEELMCLNGVINGSSMPREVVYATDL